MTARIIFTIVVTMTALMAGGAKLEALPDPDVTLLEVTGANNATAVFAITVAKDAVEVLGPQNKMEKLDPEEYACQQVMKTILFDGVENYNQGYPLVANGNDAFANSLINPKTKSFLAYFKGKYIESADDKRKVRHYILVLNNYNLLRLLKQRGSIR